MMTGLFDSAVRPMAAYRNCYCAKRIIMHQLSGRSRAAPFVNEQGVG